MFLHVYINHSNPVKSFRHSVETMHMTKDNGTHRVWKYRALNEDLFPGQRMLFWFTASLNDPRFNVIISEKKKLLVSADKTFVAV